MTQKFIDKDGLKVLWNQISLKDYPNNETLMAVIDAIDETKANKDEIVQADWNQNDETANDFIKNRPFHDEIITNEIIPYQTITFNDNGTANYSVQDPNFENLEVGTNVIVNFDGIIYNTEIINNAYYGDYLMMAEIVTEDNITVQIMTEDGSNFIVANLTGEHTLSVIEGTPLKQLDEKYIPETIARVEQLPETITDEETLYILAEAGLVNVITDENGDIFTDLDGNIIVF